MSQAPNWLPNPDQLAVLETFRRHVQEEGGPAAFARKFPTFRESRLSKILAAGDPERSRSYFDEIRTAPEEFFDQEIRPFVAKLPAMRLVREQNTQVKLYPLSRCVQMLNAVKACRDAVRRRVCKYLVGTGGGKTQMCRYLATHLKGEMPVHLIEARSSWRSKEARERAMVNVLRDVCNNVGLEIDPADFKPSNIGILENELEAHCQDTVRLFFFDEAADFSEYTLKLIKRLINQSRLIAVVATSPNAYARWGSWWPQESVQLDTRTCFTAEMPALKVPFDDLKDADLKEAREDAAFFFPAKTFSEPPLALGKVAIAARQFGHYALISGVADALQGESHVTCDELQTEIDKVWRAMSKVRAGGMR